MKSFTDLEASKTNTIGEDHEGEVVDFQRQSKIETNPISEESDPNSKNDVEASSVVLEEEEESSLFDTWILIGWTD